MNPVVIVHLFAAVVVIVAATPLIQKKVRMNTIYGIRIPVAFSSEKNWFEINRYGGRLLLFWGIVVAATAAIGAPLKRKYWVGYDLVTLAIIVVGLALVTVRIFQFGRKMRES